MLSLIRLFHRQIRGYGPRSSTALSALLGLALWAGPGLAGPAAALAAPTDFAIYTLRLGGESESAQPYIDRMAVEIENRASWPKGSAHGRFLTSRKEVMSYLDAQKPGFGILEPWLYLELRQSHQLEILAQVDSADLNSKKLHVVVKDAAVKDLAGLAGKKLWTHLADVPNYLGNVVLDGKQPIQTHCQLKQVGSALKAARAVLRGEADAALLDDEQLAMAQKLEGGAALRVVYSSPPQPAVVVVAFRGAMPDEKRLSLSKALFELCEGPRSATCKEMHINKFVAPDRKLYQDAQKRFDGGAANGKK
jgi:hypothetical protein